MAATQSLRENCFLGACWELWANRWLYYYLRGAVVVPVPPFSVNLEPTNVCNLRCPFCATRGPRRRGYLDFDLFAELAQQCAAWGVYQLALFLGGESLLHPRLPEMIAHARQLGLETILHTNAVKLTEECAEALLDAGLDLIHFSFDAEDPKTHEAMRVGSKYEETLGNIVRFLELKRERGVQRPVATLQLMRVLTSPRAEPEPVKPEFCALFAHLPLDRLLIIRAHTWSGDIAGPVGKWGSYYPCRFAWNNLSVGWDGIVLGCCNDLNGKYVLGDARQAPLWEIWNGPAMRTMREALVTGNYHRLPACRTCDMLWQEEHPAWSYARSLRVFVPLRRFKARVSAHLPFTAKTWGAQRSPEITNSLCAVSANRDVNNYPQATD